MKIALLLTGQPRFLTGESYDSIKRELLRNYDVDIFCHTWWKDNASYITAPWSGLGTIKIEGDIPQIIENIYSPKILSFDPPMLPSSFEGLDYYKNTSHQSTPYNLSSMYLSIYKCYEIFRDFCDSNNVTYDWVIRMRYDGIIDKFPDLNTLKKGQIYVSDYHGNRMSAANNGLILPFKQCSNVLSVYTKMKEIYDFLGYLNDEQIMAALFIKENLPVTFLPRKNFDISICRK